MLCTVYYRTVYSYSTIEFVQSLYSFFPSWLQVHLTYLRTLAQLYDEINLQLMPRVDFGRMTREILRTRLRYS